MINYEEELRVLLADLSDIADNEKLTGGDALVALVDRIDLSILRIGSEQV